MSQATEVTKSAIKPEIVEMAASISKVMTLDKSTGIATCEEGTYKNLLPEGLTEEIVVAVQDYNGKMAAAASLALGNAAIPAMTKNKDLNKATLTLPTVGKDYIGVNFDRSRQVPARDENNQPCGTKTKFGSTSAEYSMYATGSRGQLLAVKKELAEQALAAFGS